MPGLLTLFSSPRFKIYYPNVQNKLRIDVYEHIHALDHQWFSQQKSGDLLATLNDDINQLERFLNVGANHLIQLT